MIDFHEYSTQLGCWCLFVRVSTKISRAAGLLGVRPLADNFSNLPV